VDKNNMQGMKSATTYAKRIGLESLSGVAPDTDDDGNAAAKAAPRTISADQFIALRNAAEEAGVPEQKICAAYGAPSLEQFPVDAFDRAMKKLSATIAANAEQNQPSLGDVLAEALGNE
jgi:DNA-binding transcriptional MocR family regulator